MVVGFRLTERLKCDRQVCSRFLVAVCVTMFLEKREEMLGSFTVEFQQVTLADEKTDLLDNFLHTLSLEMDKDPIWQGMYSNILFQDLLSYNSGLFFYVCCIKHLKLCENTVYMKFFVFWKIFILHKLRDTHSLYM